MEGCRTQHGVERVDKGQGRAVRTDETGANTRTVVIKPMRPRRLDRLRRSLAKHGLRTIDRDHRSLSQSGNQLRRQPACPATNIEDSLSRLGRQAAEHSPAPLQLRVRHPVVTFGIPIRHIRCLAGAVPCSVPRPRLRPITPSLRKSEQDLVGEELSCAFRSRACLCPGTLHLAAARQTQSPAPVNKSQRLESADVAGGRDGPDA